MKRIVIKVFEQELDSKWENTNDDKLTLISHQEFEVEHNTPRNIQKLFANLARWINERGT